MAAYEREGGETPRPDQQARIEEGIRQLVLRLVDFATSSECTPNQYQSYGSKLDILQSHIDNLEREDSNFHTYRLIRAIKRKISIALDDKLKGELRRYEIANFKKNIAAITSPVIKSLSSSSEYSLLLNSVLEQTLYPLEIVHGELREGKLMTLGRAGKHRHPNASNQVREEWKAGKHCADHEDLLSRKSEFSNEDHSLYSPSSHTTLESSLEYLPPLEELKGIIHLLRGEKDADADMTASLGNKGECENLEASINSSKISKEALSEQRSVALKSLGKFSLGDLISSDKWNIILKELKFCLDDNNEFVAKESLAFHDRLFNSAIQSSQITSDVYLNIVDHLTSIFASEDTKYSCLKGEVMGELQISGEKTRSRMCLDSTLPLVRQTLEQFKVFNKFQKALPSCWLRYPEKLLLEVIEATFKLFSSSANTVGSLSSLHFVSLVDPNADWFAKWMHGNFGRMYVLNVIGQEGTGWITDICWTTLNFSCLHRTMSQNGSSKSSTHQVRSANTSLRNSSDTRRSKTSGTQERKRKLIYSQNQIDYIRFVHCINVCGNLLRYSRGRALFPVKFSYIPSLLKHYGGHKDDVSSNGIVMSVTGMLLTLIRLMFAFDKCNHLLNSTSVYTTYNSETIKNASKYGKDDKGMNITCVLASILRLLASGDQSCRETICEAGILNALIEPLKIHLDSISVEKPTHTKLATNQESIVSATLLINIADILAILASTPNGRQSLLFGIERSQVNKEKSFSSKTMSIGSVYEPGKVTDTPAFVIATYVCRAIEGVLSETNAKTKAQKNTVPCEVISAYMFVCRQLYNTCEGISMLSHFQLSYLFSKALKTSRSRLSRGGGRTCGPNGGQPQSRQKQKLSRNKQVQKLPGSGIFNRMERWHDKLIDNLLSFASTPRGVVQLIATGCLEECVSYMCERYTANMQVSRCENYGYGVMVSRIASVLPGLLALNQTGFIATFVDDVWNYLEGDPTILSKRCSRNGFCEDQSTEDQVRTKVLNNISKAVFSFSALNSLLVTETEGFTHFFNGRRTVCDLIRKLLFLPAADEEKKSQECIPNNPEESHLIGLELLGLTTSCLDTLLLFEAKFGITDHLLGLQFDYMIFTDEYYRYSETHQVTEKFDIESEHGCRENVGSKSQNNHDIEDESVCKSEDAAITNDEEGLSLPTPYIVPGNPYDFQLGYMVDDNSLARNRLLIKMGILGGENEKYVPPKDLNDFDPCNVMSEAVDFPLFSRYPIPNTYTKDLNGFKNMLTVNELGLFEEKSAFEASSMELLRLIWKRNPVECDEALDFLSDCGNSFAVSVRRASVIEDKRRDSLGERNSTNVSGEEVEKAKDGGPMEESELRLVSRTIPLLLQRFSNIYKQAMKNENLSVEKIHLRFPKSIFPSWSICGLNPKVTNARDVTKFLQTEDLIAINLITSYAKNLKKVPNYSELTLAKDRQTFSRMNVIPEYSKHIEEFEDNEVTFANNLALLIFNVRQAIVASPLFCDRQSYEGFDWFTAVIFTIFEGRLSISWSFLSTFMCHFGSAYVWPYRIAASSQKEMPFPIPIGVVHPLLYKTIHCIETILCKELPLVASAFRVSGLAPAQIATQWVRQCFINFLEWRDIELYISLSVLQGVDYQVYFCLAVIRHIQKEILQHAQTQDLVFFLRTEPIKGFNGYKEIVFMQRLADKYRASVLDILFDYENA
eukprot:Nk52_evm92s221 gene=Nk52_evmTU92s221